MAKKQKLVEKNVKSFKLTPFNLWFSSEKQVAGVSQQNVLTMKFWGLIDKFTQPFSIDMIKDPQTIRYHKDDKQMIFDRVYLNSVEDDVENIIKSANIGYEEVDDAVQWSDYQNEDDHLVRDINGVVTLAKCFTLTRLHDELIPGWIYTNIYRHTAGVRIHIEPIPDDKCEVVIRNHSTSSKTMSNVTGLDMTGNIIAIKELVLNKKYEKLFFVSVVPVITGADKKDLDNVTSRFLQATKNVPGIDTAKYIQKQILEGKHAQKILISSSAFQSLIPFHTSELYEPGGILLGWNLLTQNPVRWDINLRLNRNNVLAATSGSGKTTLAMLIIHSFEKMYPNAFIFGIDPEHEYQVLGQKMGFEYIDYSFGKKMGMDLFKMVPDAFNATETLCETLGIPEIERTTANTVAAELAGINMKERSFRKFYELIEEKNDENLLKYFRTLMNPPYIDFFDGKPPLSNKVILSLKNIGTAGGITHRLITQIALSYAMGKSLMMPKHIPKMIMLDEVWMLLQHGKLGNYIQNLSRRGRKYQINLMMATQNIEDMTNNDAARTVLVNSDTVMFLRQSESTVEALRTHFELSDLAVQYLLKLEKGQSLIKYGNDIVPTKIFVHDELLELFKAR